MNIIYAGFPGLGFQVKNICVMFVFAIVSFLFFSKYQFAVDIVQGWNLHYLKEIWANPSMKRKCWLFHMPWIFGTLIYWGNASKLR